MYGVGALKESTSTTMRFWDDVGGRDKITEEEEHAFDSFMIEKS